MHRQSRQRCCSCWAALQLFNHHFLGRHHLACPPRSIRCGVDVLLKQRLRQSQGYRCRRDNLPLPCPSPPPSQATGGFFFRRRDGTRCCTTGGAGRRRRFIWEAARAGLLLPIIGAVRRRSRGLRWRGGRCRGERHGSIHGSGQSGSQRLSVSIWVHSSKVLCHYDVTLS